MFLFNVRVYGVLINNNNEILLSDEEHGGVRLTKFPGGGLEYGEGLVDALKREFIEECNLEIDVLEHLYTTDFFEKSAFNESQIISIYYLIKVTAGLETLRIADNPFDFPLSGDKLSFRWKSLADLSAEDLTFLTERKALSILLERKQTQLERS